MLDISFTELLVIGGVALVVLGPEKLPVVARAAGKLLGKAQGFVNDVKADIAREGELAELKKFRAEMEQTARSIEADVTASTAPLQNELTDINAQLGTQANTAAATDIAPSNASLEAQGEAILQNTIHAPNLDLTSLGNPISQDPIAMRMELELLEEQMLALEARLQSLRGDMSALGHQLAQEAKA